MDETPLQGNGRKEKTAEVDDSTCLRCGVCHLKCSEGAISLVKREQRVFQPEDLFEKIILLALDRGTLENQLFSDPASLSYRFMVGFVSGFCRLPSIKKKLLSDQFRSRFLQVVRFGARLQGRGWLAEL